jgi:hypothetical protein
MKSFKFIREGNYVEPGVSAIDDAPEDPLSFVEIKPKKTKIVKEAMSKDDMSSVALQAMVAKKNLKQTAGKNKSQAFVDKMVSKVNSGDRLPKKPADEYDRKVTTYLKKKYNEENMVETKGAPKGFHFTKDGKLKRGDANQDGDGGTMLRADPLDKQRNKIPAVSEGIDFSAIWNSIKSVHEEIKTTHEDPLVVTKDEEGNIHTHANLSVANAIHGTDVKHQAIHTGKPVQGGKFTFELSKHHEGALKEDAPFDPVAHKKELDKLMGKHMAAHTETSKLISAKAPQEAINKAQERNNAIKAEIRAHKDKVPKGPAKKDGGPGAYYASKKPGEYTGD